MTSLAPAPLPEAASAIPGPGDDAEQHAPGAVLDALTARYGLDPRQLKIDEGFEAWMASGSSPIRIHLARFTGLDAPREAIEPLGGVFKPISQMRGMPMTELNPDAPGLQSDHGWRLTPTTRPLVRRKSIRCRHSRAMC